MKISWHGHSCIKITTSKDKVILIDPFISDNPFSDLDPETVQADYIVLTHGHNDHVGDAEAIARRTDALLISNFEIATYFEKKGLRTHGMQPGGKFCFDFGVIKMTPAIHGSVYEDENGLLIPMGLAMGAVFLIEEHIIFHAGDTALFSDMKLIARFDDIDIAFLPIGDNFTMGPEEAAIAAKWLHAKKVIPIHYNTFPAIKQKPQDFVDALESPEKGQILSVGETLSISKN